MSSAVVDRGRPWRMKLRTPVALAVHDLGNSMFLIAISQGFLQSNVIYR